MATAKNTLRKAKPRPLICLTLSLSSPHKKNGPEQTFRAVF